MDKKNTLLYLTIAGIVLGGFCGWMFGKSMEQVAWLGEMFLDALKMLVIPLIVSSMIVGISGLGDVRKVGLTGGVTLLYFMITTGIAVVIGLVLVNIIQPGEGVSAAGVTLPERVSGKEEAGLVDIVKSFISSNIVESMVKMEILPIIIFSLAFGGVLTTLGEKGQAAIDFFDTVNLAIMKMVHIVMYFAPIGIFGLVSSKLGAAGGGEMFLAELAKIGKYVFTVIAALLIHAVVVLPLFLKIFGKRNPLEYFKQMSEAILTAFSTASSSATMPVTIDCAEERAMISRKACLFVLPLGATVNMNGTALYEAVAALFIAQMFDIQLGFTGQAIVFLTATLAAIGAAGIPEAGLVTMVMVLQAAGLPLEGVGMLLAIDWFLDRCRTSVNVWSDSVGAAVIDQLEKDYNLGGK